MWFGAQVPDVPPYLLCSAMADSSQEPAWEAQEQAAPNQSVAMAVREAQQRCSTQRRAGLQEAP